MMSELFEIGKLPPQDIELEKAILGSIILESDSCHIGMKLLKNDVFYDSINNVIFKAIENVFIRREPVDILTITSELKSLKQLDNIGGAYFLTQLTNRISSGSNTEFHCRILLQLYLKRRLIALGSDITKQGYNDSVDVFDTLNYFHKKIKDIEAVISSDVIVNNEQTITEVKEDIQNAKANGGIIGYSTGIKSLDHGLMGLRTKLKYEFAASPGEGKTSIVKSICLNLAHNQNIPGVFFSMEMTRRQLMMACISEILQIPNTRIQKGDINSIELQNIENLKKTLFAKNFLIDDRGGLDPVLDIRPTLRKLVDQFGIKWFALDYLGLAKLKGKHNFSKSRENIISEITAETKNMAKEFDLICFEISQVSRDSNKGEKRRRYKLSDLKDSSSIEANADCVIFVSRPEYHGFKTLDDNVTSSKGFAELILAKNRFGPIKSLPAIYKGEFTQFLEHPNGIELEISEDTPF